MDPSGQLLNGLDGFKYVWTALKRAAGFESVPNILYTIMQVHDIFFLSAFMISDRSRTWTNMAQTDGRCCSAIRPHYPVGNYMYMYIRVNIQHAYNVCIHVHFEYVQCTQCAFTVYIHATSLSVTIPLW